MGSSKYNYKFNNRGTKALLGVLLVAASACGQRGPLLHESFTEGQQFAHYIVIPAQFQKADPSESGLIPFFDHYSFRIGSSSPNILLVAACTRDNACSTNSFSIDTEHSYMVRETAREEWDRAISVTGVVEMEGPPHRNVHEESGKSSEERARPIGPNVAQLDYEGYRYRNKTYLRRGDWITSLHFANSVDGKLIVLAGADKRKLPKSGFIVGNAVGGGLYGTFTLDIFYSDPSHRVAALEIDCKEDVLDALGHVSVVNSRWVTVGLDVYMQHMLLLDFQPVR